MADDQRRREWAVPLPGEALEEPADRSGAGYEELEGLLRLVSEEDRQVLRLVVADHSVAEIAKLLEVGYSAAGMRIHRARTRLRKRMGSEETGRGGLVSEMRDLGD